jgi:hypothetical protein
MKTDLKWQFSINRINYYQNHSQPWLSMCSDCPWRHKGLKILARALVPEARLFHSMHFNVTLSNSCRHRSHGQSSIVISCCQIWHTIASCEQPRPIRMFCSISYRGGGLTVKIDIISRPAITRLEWLLNNYVIYWHRGCRLQKRGI